MGDILFLCNGNDNGIGRAFTKQQISDNPIINYEQLITQKINTTHIKYIFSTWGMPKLTSIEIKEYLPNLVAVFYAAGSVQAFARPFLECGVRIFSAWVANAVPVAEVTVAQIILSNKGFYQLHCIYKKDYKSSINYGESFPGNYNTSVGLLGAGMIGSYVINLLKQYRLNVKVFDPFLNEEKAKELGVKKASIEEIFETCQTISNHLANNQNTQNIINYDLFSLMKHNATFINTGRGAQVDMNALIKTMREKPECTALLDVTDPTEPLPPDSELWQLDNVFLTPHRAGSITDEIMRMGDYMFAEYTKVCNNLECLYEVSFEMLKTMA